MKLKVKSETDNMCRVSDDTKSLIYQAKGTYGRRVTEDEVINHGMKLVLVEAELRNRNKK